MGLVQGKVFSIFKIVNIVMIGKCLKFSTVGLTCSPQILQWILTIGWRSYPVDIVILGLILKATMVIQSSRSRSIHDVVLKQVLAGGDIAVEVVGTAVVGPAIGHEIVVESDVGIARLLQPSLVHIVTAVVGGPSLDTSKVTGDASTKVMDMVVLNIDNIVSATL